MYINSEDYGSVRLSELYKALGITRLEQGDTVVLTTTLPDAGDFPFPVILFKSRYSTLTCYVDGELIFDYGKSMYERKAFLGKKFHFISLPAKYQGKEFSMELHISENGAFTALDPPMLGKQMDLESRFVNEHMMIIATGLFLFMFGVAFLVITMFFVSATPDIMSFLISSVLCMNLGAWILSYYNVLSLFFYTERETEIEYFTLYLIVPYSYLMVYFIDKIEKKALYFAMAIASTLVTVSQFVLHYAFNIHMKSTLPMYHITAVSGFFLLMYFVIRNLRKKDTPNSTRIQIVGLLAFSAAELIHLIVYLFDTYHIPVSDFLGIVTLDTGCLIFVMCQIANYLLYVTQSYAQRKEHASLSHLAYADGLTNMPNRARADKFLEELSETDSDYCIISVDLNGLKIVNDKYGHPSGDKYIKEFSKVLLTTFADVGLCARIGGDEFVVIIEDSTDKDVTALIGRMNSALNVLNALYSDYHRSVAAGYAFRHECPKGAPAHEVYLLADERMYELKRKMHEELGIRTRL